MKSFDFACFWILQCLLAVYELKMFFREVVICIVTNHQRLLYFLILELLELIF